MGIGKTVNDDVQVEDGNGDGDEKPFGGVGNFNKNHNNNRECCSICLELVLTDNAGDRSWAKLQCGHQFHLDCIGSAFNTKGVMQCPNCRKVEKGQWLYAAGYRSLPEFIIDDWAHGEDHYDLSHSEMSFGVHWCPSLAQLLPSFEDREFSSDAYNADHELLGQHAMFAEQTAAVSSPSHLCPYIAYFGPIHHPSSSNSSGSVSDGLVLNSHWTGPSLLGDISSSYPVPALDLRYRSWEHHFPPLSTTTSRMSSIEQLPVPSTTRRPASSRYDHQRPGFIHPFLVGQGDRASSSITSSVSPLYQGSNARTHDRVQALQAYYQQQPGSTPAIGTPTIPGTQRSSSNRGLSQVGAAASSSDQNGFYFVPSAASGHSFQDTENTLPARLQARERDHFPSFALSQTDRDAGWGALHQANGGSDSSIRLSSFHQRHGSERMSSSQNGS